MTRRAQKGGRLMLDGSHYFDCLCGTGEHTLRFIVDRKNAELYTEVYIGRKCGFWRRLRAAFLLAVGRGNECRYGHFDVWILKREDVARLAALLEEVTTAEAEREGSNP